MELSFTQQDRELLSDLSDAIRTITATPLPNVLISNKEAARFLGVSYATINNYIKTGRLERRTIDGVQGVMLADVVKMKKNPQ